MFSCISTSISPGLAESKQGNKGGGSKQGRTEKQRQKQNVSLHYGGM